MGRPCLKKSDTIIDHVRCDATMLNFDRCAQSFNGFELCHFVHILRSVLVFRGSAGERVLKYHQSYNTEKNNGECGRVGGPGSELS